MKLNKHGQGLVELIVTIAIIEVGLFSVWSLFLVNFNAEKEAELRIVGVNLAREGAEVVRNIRDANWLKRGLNEKFEAKIWTWDHGLESGVYSLNFDSQTLESEEFKRIYLDSNGFFSNIVTDNSTFFQRLIILKDICCNDLDSDFKCDDIDYAVTESSASCPLKIGVNIVSRVFWKISGQDRSAVIEYNLYDWQ